MYAEVADLEARYAGQCFALAGVTETGELDREAIARALEEATDEINLTLQARYSVPLTPVPPVIRRVCIDLAVGALPRNGATEATVYERRAKDARALLVSLAKGDTTLGAGASPAPAPAGSGGGIGYAGPQSDFRQKLDDL